MIGLNVDGLEGLRKFAQRPGGEGFEEPKFVCGYTFGAECRVQVVEQVPAVLEVGERPVKYPVERSAAHGLGARIAGARTAVARMQKPRGAKERAGSRLAPEKPLRVERLVRR